MRTATVKIYRHFQTENQTSGSCTVLNEFNAPLFSALSLERGWQGNKNNVSCVPKGIYNAVFEYSPRFKKKLLELKDVPSRAECKFHAANYWDQLNGCIALGLRYINLNKDGYLDLTNSQDSLERFHESLKGFDKIIVIIAGEVNIK